MNNLDKKLNEIFPGKVVRKDLLNRIKKGTNVPTFVLEFLLARYCASDDPDEIDAGIQAVFQTIEKNFVRPDESNRAQSLVQQKGKYKFIDKVHVTHNEKERRHWAEMENFNSRRIAIPEKYYRNNDRLLEGGVWAEVTLGYNEVDDDDYTFYVEELRPIQLSKFDFDNYLENQAKFTRDEWLDILMRSSGLEPEKMNFRLKMHYLSRLFCFVESNYNFIELGPRGTGKSYAYSEFSPYSTLVSQVTTPVLFYNTRKSKVGLVGYWDTVAFDEVGRIKMKDSDTIDNMKNYMANGRFSRGVEVIANASFAFVGNLDFSIDQLVKSHQFDLLAPLPKEFDLAIIDRFFHYLPGWEIPKNSSEYLTKDYGFITDYLAEAFHMLAKSSKYDFVNKHCKYGDAIEGRDELAINKSISAILKLLHPANDPSSEELDQYIEYAMEGRRRVKEQLNKRKNDDEYENVNLSFINSNNKEVIVWCPESKNAKATQQPNRKDLNGEIIKNYKKKVVISEILETTKKEIKEVKVKQEDSILEEQHFKIFYGEKGNSYKSLFGKYFRSAKKIKVEDPYIRSIHQIQNFLRLCELIVETSTIKEIELLTYYDNNEQKKDIVIKMNSIISSIATHNINLTINFNSHLHDREIKLDNGWVIRIGRGLDYFQPPEDWFTIGASDMDLRPCLETKVDIHKVNEFKK